MLIVAKTLLLEVADLSTGYPQTQIMKVLMSKVKPSLQKVSTEMATYALIVS